MPTDPNAGQPKLPSTRAGAVPPGPATPRGGAAPAKSAVPAKSVAPVKNVAAALQGAPAGKVASVAHKPVPRATESGASMAAPQSGTASAAQVQRTRPPKPWSGMRSRARLVWFSLFFAGLAGVGAVTMEMVHRSRRAAAYTSTPSDSRSSGSTAGAADPTTARSPDVVFRQQLPHAPRVLFEPIAALSYEERCMGKDDKGFVGLLSPDTWLKYEGVDFGAGANWFSATVAVSDASAGKTIEVRLKNPRGPIIAALRVESTGGWFDYAAQVAPMTPTVGVHDVFLTFSGGNSVANLRSFKFTRTPRATTGDIAARQYDAMSGIRDHQDKIGSCDEGHWVRYGGLDFKDSLAGANAVSIELACPEDYAGNVIEIRLDSLTATPIGELTVASTGGWDKSMAQTASLKAVTGMHDVYLTFRGGNGVADIYSLAFERK